MSYILCLVTVISVDWKRSEFQSTPVVVPCTGQDQVLRLELITVPTRVEYQELQQVLNTVSTRQKNVESRNFMKQSSFIGPRLLGQHYDAMLRENQDLLSQNNTVRLISITERVSSGQVSREDHLLGRLVTSTRPDPTEESTSTSTVKPKPTKSVIESTTNPADGWFERIQLLDRSRRMADVNTKVTAHIDTDVSQSNDKYGSDNSDSKHMTTGGGYGSQTCTNAQFTAWNNSTFTSGTCGCECPTCPPCDTASLMVMVDNANKERMSIQSKLLQCQEKMVACHRIHSTAENDPRDGRCRNGEIRRLKEETRSLRARIRSVTSSQVLPSVSPTKSTLVSSLETVGSALVEGAVQYSAQRSMTRSNTNAVKPSATASPTGFSGTRSLSSTKNRKTRPSRIPTPVGARTASKRPTSSSGKIPRKTRQGRRGRRETDLSNLRMGPYHPWSDATETYKDSPFALSESQAKLKPVNNMKVLIPQVHHVRTSTNQMYNTTHWRRRNRHQHTRRGRRDAYDSSFIGSSNQAEITAFDHASFQGSTENRYDNSSNVRSFRPVISPRIHVNSRGKNETLITKSHNGNEIRITNAPPCKCEDDFGVIMVAVWTQMVLTVILTLSIGVHYYLNRKLSHQKKKDLDLVRMQAHTVYRKNRSSRIIKTHDRRQKALSTPVYTVKECVPELETY